MIGRGCGAISLVSFLVFQLNYHLSVAIMRAIANAASPQPPPPPPQDRSDASRPRPPP